MKHIMLQPISQCHLTIELDGKTVGELIKGERGWAIYLGDAEPVHRRLFERALDYVARKLEV